MEEPGPHTQRQWEPVHQEGSEHSQLPPPGYLIDSSNHPRWVDTLKSNQSLREPAAGDCRCYHGNSNLARPEVHLGPSPALGLRRPAARCRGYQLLHPQLEERDWPGGAREVRVQPGLGFMTLHKWVWHEVGGSRRGEKEEGGGLYVLSAYWMLRAVYRHCHV